MNLRKFAAVFSLLFSVPVLFAPPVLLLETGCNFVPPKCKDPKATWWDCKLTWRSNQTESDQTAKAWICATSFSTVQQAALDAGLDCAVPEGKKATIKCIDSKSNIQPEKPLQEFSVPSELERKPMNWGDPDCNQCMGKNCSASVVSCAQNNGCSCLDSCQVGGQNGIDACNAACNQFFDQNSEAIYLTFEDCAWDFCADICINGTAEPTKPSNQCCKNIGCKIE